MKIILISRELWPSKCDASENASGTLNRSTGLCTNVIIWHYSARCYYRSRYVDNLLGRMDVTWLHGHGQMYQGTADLGMMRGNVGQIIMGHANPVVLPSVTFPTTDL